MNGHFADPWKVARIKFINKPGKDNIVPDTDRIVQVLKFRFSDRIVPFFKRNYLVFISALLVSSAFMADYEDITVEGRLASSKYPLRLNRKIPQAVLNNDSFFEIQEFFVRNSEVCVLSPIVIE